MKAWKLFAAAVAVVGCVAGAAAQEWPQKPVKIVVPYPAGAGVDPVARLVGQKLAERWKQTVIVDNRPGAGGQIAATDLYSTDAEIAFYKLRVLEDWHGGVGQKTCGTGAANDTDDHRQDQELPGTHALAKARYRHQVP